MNKFFEIILWILGIVLFPITILLALVLILKLEAFRKTDIKDHYKIEADQFDEMGIDLSKSANIKKASIYKVDTSFGKSEVIRWTKKHEKVVVFVHGILCDKFTSSKTVYLWDKLGYDVISFDGYGWGSTREFNAKTKFAGKEQINLLNTVINDTLKRYKLNDVLLHGESMGGGTVYGYIESFGTNKLEKIVVDAGYLSFLNNFVYLGADIITLPITIMLKPFVSIMFLLKGYPKKMIKPKTLALLDKKLIHLHSVEDDKVLYKYIKNEKKHFQNNSKFYLYKSPNVRHVRGYYDAPEELQNALTAFVKNK